MLPSRNVIPLFFCICALFGCDKPSTNADHSNDKPLLEIPQDSGMYIGIAMPLSRNEFYIELYLKDSVEINDDIHEFLQGSTDSLVYQDDVITRSRLPRFIAEEYFDFTHLEHLDLFDSAGHAIGTAELQQVEFYEDLIETRIIAVYRTDVASPVAYVIGGDDSSDRIEGFSSRSIKDPGFEKTFTAKVQSLADSTTRVRLFHKKIEPGSSVYSFGSDDQNSYIFDHSTSEIVYARADMMFLQIIPVHKQRNNKPVFLAVVGHPETDIRWSMLLIFDGKEYNSTVHQRLNKPADQ